MKTHKNEVEFIISDCLHHFHTIESSLSKYKYKINELEYGFDVHSYMMDHTNYRDFKWKEQIITIVDAHEKKEFTRLSFTKYIMNYIHEKKLHQSKKNSFLLDSHLREIFHCSNNEIKYKYFQQFVTNLFFM